MAKQNNITIRSSAAEYLTYASVVGEVENSVEMRYEDENVWLTQKMMVQLYDVDVRTINKHIQKVFTDNKLSENSTVRNFRIVQTEGSCEVKHYRSQTFFGIRIKNTP